MTFGIKNLLNNVPYARVKGLLEPTHLKSSPLFTCLRKSLGQDSPSIHLFSKIIGSRLTAAKKKVGWRFTKLICVFLVKIYFQTKKTRKIGQDSLIPKFIYLKFWRRDNVESLTILEEDEFKVPIDGCIRNKTLWNNDPLGQNLFDITNYQTCVSEKLPSGIETFRNKNLSVQKPFAIMTFRNIDLPPYYSCC